MVENETFTLLLAFCEDIFNSCYQNGLYAGLAMGLIIGFMFFLAWFMIVRKDILKEDYNV